MENTAEKTTQTQPQEVDVKDEKIKIYCLKCRKHQPVLNLRKRVTTFESRKTHTPMSRLSFVGECSVCHRRVLKFAKQ